MRCNSQEDRVSAVQSVDFRITLTIYPWLSFVCVFDPRLQGYKIPFARKQLRCLPMCTGGTSHTHSCLGDLPASSPFHSWLCPSDLAEAWKQTEFSLWGAAAKERYEIRSPQALLCCPQYLPAPFRTALASGSWFWRLLWVPEKCELNSTPSFPFVAWSSS